MYNDQLPPNIFEVDQLEYKLVLEFRDVMYTSHPDYARDEIGD
jgi:hypothetical protein